MRGVLGGPKRRPRQASDIRGSILDELTELLWLRKLLPDDTGFRVEGSGFRCLRFRIQGLGFRV